MAVEAVKPCIPHNRPEDWEERPAPYKRTAIYCKRCGVFVGYKVNPDKGRGKRTDEGEGEESP